MIRSETPGDITDIGNIITKAFMNIPHSNQTEAAIVDRLRDDGKLSVSLVETRKDQIIGHIAFSRVKVGNEFSGWYGLGPVSVLPEWQHKGIGSKLVNAGLERLRALDARGCVLLGEPDFYTRFGFSANSRLKFQEAPAEYFLTLPFGEDIPTGEVRYHDAFYMENP